MNFLVSLIASGLTSLLGFGLKKMFPNKSPEEIQAIIDKVKPMFSTFVTAGLLKAQAEIVKQEASSSLKFVSYAHAALLWVCIIVFTYGVLVIPVLNYTCALLGYPSPALPDIPIHDITDLLLVLLGIGTVHTYMRHKD